jgi:catechol 2,3-dioxygenase-like lactoylglutathione lyase family enzyme
MPITAFLHVSICISDPAKSVPFYRDILGFEVVAELHYDGPGPSQVMDLPQTDLTVWLLTNNAYRLELIHFKNPPSQPLAQRPRTNSLGLSHLTVGITDPDATIAELKAKGVKVLENTRGSFDGRYPRAMFLFEDPDGFLIETYVQEPGAKLPYI